MASGFDEWMRNVARPLLSNELGFRRDEIDFLRHLHRVNGPLHRQELEAQILVAQARFADDAVSRLNADISADGRIEGTVGYHHDRANIRITLNGLTSNSDSGGLVSYFPEAAVIVEVATCVQHMVVLWHQTPWPECPLHLLPLDPEIRSGTGTWTCRRGHQISEIGGIGDSRLD